MEQNNNTKTLTISESARINFNDFVEKLKKWFPNHIFPENMQLTAREKSVEVHIPLSAQDLIEDVVDVLAERGNVNVLFAISKDDGKKIKVIGYSMPYSDEMYVISIESLQYGVIDEIVVAFYDSIEEMFQDVRFYYLSGKYLLEEPGTEILEAEDYSKMLSHFM